MHGIYFEWFVAVAVVLLFCYFTRTNALGDAGQRLFGVRRARDVRSDVLGGDVVLAAANVLANVRHSLILAARHVVPAVFREQTGKKTKQNHWRY